MAAWTREDPLLGYLLWTGPYSAAGRGMLTVSLTESSFGECMTHLDALAALRYCPAGQYRGDVLGRLSLLLSELGRVAQADAAPGGPLAGAPIHPAVGGRSGCSSRT